MRTSHNSNLPLMTTAPLFGAPVICIFKQVV